MITYIQLYLAPANSLMQDQIRPDFQELQLRKIKQCNERGICKDLLIMWWDT